MDVASAALSALATLSILVVAATLFRLGGRSGAAERRSAALAGAAGMLTILGAWATGLTGIPPAFAAPVVALGALFAVIVIGGRLEEPTRAIFASVALSLAVFLPLAMVTFGTLATSLFTSAGIIDLGAALPALIGAGAASAGFSLVERRSMVAGPRGKGLTWRRLALLPLLWGAWIGWLVGFELALDSSTPIIATNAVVLPAAALIAGVAMERIRHRTNTPAGTTIALLSGLAAAAPACAFLEPPLAVLVGLVVGAISALLPRRDWPTRLGLTVAVSAAISFVLLGLLAKNFGFIYTGQPEVTFGQLGAVLLGGGLGLAVGVVVSTVKRRARIR